MIIDRIQNAGLYAADQKLARALQYLAKTDFTKMAPGKVEIDGTALFALIQTPTTRAKESAQFEVHRKYIDVQYIVEGVEIMGYAHLSALSTITPYNTENDAEFLIGEGNFITVRAGFFVVFYPEDAHMPCLACGQPKPTRKVVIKIAVG
jgi:YhcH/YjgK/YiaL family protein